MTDSKLLRQAIPETCRRIALPWCRAPGHAQPFRSLVVEDALPALYYDRAKETLAAASGGWAARGEAAQVLVAGAGVTGCG